MSRARMLLVATTLVAAGAVHVLLASQAPQFRTGTHTVPVYATVVGADGQIVTDLARDDFQILDNGRLQPVTTFVKDVQPITVVLMLDRSGSVETLFALVRDAALSFVDALLPGDLARIGSFSRYVQIDPEAFTGDRDELRGILLNRLQPAGATPLWNATNAALTALQDEPGRRVVVVFSDGRDAPLTLGGALINVPFGEVRRRVEREDTMVYVIGLTTPCAPAPSPGAAPDDGTEPRADVTLSAGVGESPDGGAAEATRFQRGGGRGGQGGASPRRPGGTGGVGGRRGLPIPVPGRLPFPVPGRGLPPVRPVPPPASDPWLDSNSGCRPTGPDPSLRVLADAGGGGYFELTEAENLRATFTRIADELHQQYLLGFVAPEHDGVVHRVEVRVARPGVHVRARSRYVAPVAGPTARPETAASGYSGRSPR